MYEGNKSPISQLDLEEPKPLISQADSADHEVDPKLSNGWAVAPDGNAETTTEKTIAEVGAEIVSAASTLKTNEPVSGEKLKELHDLFEKNNAELTRMRMEDEQIDDALLEMETEWQKRQKAVADVTTSLQSPEDLRQAIPENAVVTEVTNQDGVVTTTLTDESGQTTEVKADEQSVWAFLLLMTLSDVLLGSNNLSVLADAWITNKVSGPALTKLGVDTSSLYDRFASHKHEAFNGFIKTADSRQMTQIFTDSIRDRTSFAILEQLDPEHLNKMFDPTGTKAFGKAGGMFSGTYDHIQLSQDLVDKLYAGLSESERRRLRMPTKTV